MTPVEGMHRIGHRQKFHHSMISPDGRWIVFVGSSVVEGQGVAYHNTDIYVCRIDGTDLRQLTHHAADDLSPIWKPRRQKHLLHIAAWRMPTPQPTYGA